jgi:hypothetical protein
VSKTADSLKTPSRSLKNQQMFIEYAKVREKIRTRKILEAMPSGTNRATALAVPTNDLRRTFF